MSVAGVPAVPVKVKRRVGEASATTRTLLEARHDPNAKPAVRQLREMIQLRRSTTALSPVEYHKIGLHDLSLYADVDITEVCGSRMRHWLHHTLNNPNWDAVVTDKAIMAMVFRQAGIPHPELYAIYTQYDRACGTTPVVRTRSDLEAFMVNDMPLPAFVKPVKGGSGASCHRIDAVTTDTGTGTDTGTETGTETATGNVALTIDGGTRLGFDDFINQLHDPTGWGFLLQEAMQPHPDTIPIAGDAVTGLRMVVLLGDDGPTLFRTIWKLPASGSITDNYGVGDRGNAAAEIDVDTGTVRTVQWGHRPGANVNDPHPDTGTHIAGITVPGWTDAVDTTLHAARAFPGFRFQHWDLGLTNRGPVVYELNSDGDLFDADFPGSRGTYEPQLREFVATYGHDPQHARHRGTPPK